MNEYTMELVNELRKAERENMRLRERIDQLMALSVREEIADAKFRLDNAKRGYPSIEPNATIKCDDVNAIFRWARSEEADRILEEARKEANNGESV